MASGGMFQLTIAGIVFSLAVLIIMITLFTVASMGIQLMILFRYLFQSPCTSVFPMSGQSFHRFCCPWRRNDVFYISGQRRLATQC